jgi:hypothetical protein
MLQNNAAEKPNGNYGLHCSMAAIAAFSGHGI